MTENEAIGRLTHLWSMYNRTDPEMAKAIDLGRNALIHKPDEEEPEADHPIDGPMNFGGALQALRAGLKVARAGWNGKGMWIVLMPALKLPPYSSQEPGAKVNDRTAKHIGVDTPLDSQPYFAMWTAAKQWQPGWLASQADMLAEDWMVVE